MKGYHMIEEKKILRKPLGCFETYEKYSKHVDQCEASDRLKTLDDRVVDQIHLCEEMIDKLHDMRKFIDMVVDQEDDGEI